MPLVAAYHRPQELDETLALMAEPNRVVLAGGTVLNADRAPSRLEAVDIQACGLDSIDADGDRLALRGHQHHLLKVWVFLILILMFLPNQHQYLLQRSEKTSPKY